MTQLCELFTLLCRHVPSVMQLFYIATSRELKRLDSLAMSPIFGHFSESIAGLLTLRAFRMQATFTRTNHQRLDRSNRVYWVMQNVCALEAFPSANLSCGSAVMHTESIVPGSAPGQNQGARCPAPAKSAAMPDSSLPETVRAHL